MFSKIALIGSHNFNDCKNFIIPITLHNNVEFIPYAFENFWDSSFSFDVSNVSEITFDDVHFIMVP